MALRLMYITNKPDVARIAEEVGVDRIFIDMEYIGKEERQGGLDTVQYHHTINDIEDIKRAITKAEILVRVNPIHEATNKYMSSQDEIEAVIQAGVDRIMLPYFKTIDEVKQFISYVRKRCKITLLVETPEAVDIIDGILKLPDIDEVFIGLNDLSLGYGKNFMFELLADGTVETLCLKFRKKGIPYGFGGIAAIGKGVLPAEKIIKEHYRLGSSCTILSRSFCNTGQITDLETIKNIFQNGVSEIRKLEKECEEYSSYFWENVQNIKTIVENLKK